MGDTHTVRSELSSEASVPGEVERSEVGVPKSVALAANVEVRLLAELGGAPEGGDGVWASPVPLWEPLSIAWVRV